MSYYTYNTILFPDLTDDWPWEDYETQSPYQYAARGSTASADRTFSPIWDEVFTHLDDYIWTETPPRSPQVMLFASTMIEDFTTVDDGGWTGTQADLSFRYRPSSVGTPWQPMVGSTVWPYQIDVFAWTRQGATFDVQYIATDQYQSEEEVEERVFFLPYALAFSAGETYDEIGFAVFLGSHIGAFPDGDRPESGVSWHIRDWHAQLLESTYHDEDPPTEAATGFRTV